MKTPFATTQTNMMRRAGIDVVGDIPWGTHFLSLLRHEG